MLRPHLCVKLSRKSHDRATKILAIFLWSATLTKRETADHAIALVVHESRIAHNAPR